jgi:hypothetical protein
MEQAEVCEPKREGVDAVTSYYRILSPCSLGGIRDNHKGECEQQIAAPPGTKTEPEASK